MRVWYGSMHGRQFMAFASSNRLVALRWVCGVKVVEFAKKNLRAPIRTSRGALVLQIEGVSTASVDLLRSMAKVHGARVLSCGKRRPARCLSMANAVARALLVCGLRARVSSPVRTDGRLKGRAGAHAQPRQPRDIPADR